MAGEALAELDLRETRDGVSLRVRVKPRSSRDAVSGTRAGALVIQLEAPPVEGAANAALLELLAQVLDRPPSALQIAHGTSGRDKIVQVSGIALTAARDRLRAAL